MALITLLTRCTATPSGEFVTKSFLFNTQTLLVEETEVAVVFTCSVFERQLDELVYTICQGNRIGDTRLTEKLFYYVGNGEVRQETVFNSTSCPVVPAPTCDIDEPVITVTPPTVSGGRDGKITIQSGTSRPPLRFLLNGTTNTTGQETGIFTGVLEGTYTGLIYDDAQCEKRFGPVRVQFDTSLLLKSQSFPVFNDPENPDRITGYFRTFSVYDPAARVAVRDANESGEQLPDFSRSTTELVDEYFLSDNATFRRVYHDGNFDLRFEDVVIPGGGTGGGPGGSGQPGQLRFVNIIKTDIDEAGTASGMVLLEATNDGVGGAITYSRPTVAQSGNTDGGFSGLPAGTYRFRATDASGQSVEEDVTLVDAYRPRWRLLTQDVTREALEVVILERSYDGEVEQVCATASSPLTRRWEGAGNDPLSQIPELVGSSATLQLLTPDPRPFQVLATGDDRRHRVDVYRSGVLEGRFYVTPDLLRVQVHEALPTISITATDGLGSLRDTLFENHRGARVTFGRWPVLHTLLHALSRTDINLPLYVNVQLRDVLMADTVDPLAATAHDREAYGKDTDTPLLYDVVTALLRPYNACLWQARGAWWIASPLDMALAATAEANELWTGYNMAGQELLSLPAPRRSLDLWAVKNPGELTQGRQLEWEAPGAEQATTAAAKVVQATTKLQLRESSLSGGELQDWNAAGTLPVFWAEGPAERIVGEKAGSYALRLPAGGKVLTTPVQTLPAPDYSPIVFRVKARSLANPLAQTTITLTQNGVQTFTLPGAPELVQVSVARNGEVNVLPQQQYTYVNGVLTLLASASLIAGNIVTYTVKAPPLVLVVTVLTEGVPDPQQLRFEVPRGGNEAKMQEYSATLPATRTGRNIRIRLENTGTAALDLGYVRAQILPALLEWPDEDTVTVVQADGYLQAPTVELVHADQPRLALAPDVLVPPQGMDVFAWKHAFTTLDGRATSLWRRPGVRQPAPLLETAALDALELRSGEQRTLGGRLLGFHGVGALSFGQLVVSPDARGVLLWVVSCELDDEDGSATAVLRPIGVAPEAQLPRNARLTTARQVRVTTDGAIRVTVP